MMHKSKHIAVDWGASGGKMAGATFDGERLRIDGYSSLPNHPLQTPGALYWDVFALYNHTLDSLGVYAAKNGSPDTVGIDTWGATYGLLDRYGRLIEPVYHYRDARTEKIMEPLFDKMSRRELFRLTGCQCNRTYTLPQLYACLLEGSPALENTERLLFLPDLLSYFLCGEAVSEKTIAGTSALLTTRQDDWEPQVFERFGLPIKLLSPLEDPGTVKGELLPYIAQRTGIRSARVINTIGHDSAAAVAAIPGFGPGKLYISIGTNISMGIEGDCPQISDKAFAGGLKNTGGMDGTIITYRDFPAFWLINELLASWRREGKHYSFDDLHALAEGAQSCGAVADPECSALNTPGGDMREKLRDHLQATGQPVPGSDGEFVRCIFESLALKIKYVAGVMADCTGRPHSRALVINGGARNKLLVRMICDALEIPVQFGMHYATLAGNLLCQLKAAGHVSGLSEMREVSENTFSMESLLPGECSVWEDRLEKAIRSEICM